MAECLQWLSPNDGVLEVVGLESSFQVKGQTKNDDE
jgi:hypothetical protein